MKIGTLGSVAFIASEKLVRTFDQFTRKRTARYAKHDVTERKPVLQFLGQDLDEITFTMHLNAGHGVNPANELKKLGELLSSGLEQNLVIGGQKFGMFVLEDFTETWKRLDGKGRLMVADVNVKLREYANGN